MKIPSTLLLIPAISLTGITPQANAEEYRGKFTPDVEYVLSGQLAKDTGPLPEMPFHYISDEDGFDSSRLTPVPAPGVHPRVLMSPEDIVRIRGEVAKGDQADRYFRIIWNDVQTLAKKNDVLSMSLQALVTEDEELGRKAALMVLEKAKFFEPMVDLLNSHPDMAPTRDNWYYYARTNLKKVGGRYYKDAYDEGGAELIAELAKESVEFGSDGDKQSSGNLFNCTLSNYDYVYDFLTEDERAIVRRVISKLVRNRYTAGMELPGNMFINNHMSMGEDLILLSLAIEGEEGEADPRLLEQYAISVGHKINYDVSLGGLLHEKCKGFLPERATIAIGRRLDKTLLRHNHLQLMVWGKIMDSNKVFQRYAGLPNAAPIGEGFTEERFWWQGRGSGPWMDQFFNWAFVMKHYYPNDPATDYFYKSQLRAVGLGAAGTDPSEKLPTPRIRYTHRDVMLMTATDGLRNPDGTVVDYDQQGLPKEITDRSPVWVDMARGVGMSRASWDEDALSIHYEARSDVYSAGHETPEAGDFNLIADGIEWSARSLWYLDAYFRNTVLVDGYAGIYSPVAAKLLAVEDSEQGTTFISDNTNQYNWRKHEKLFYLWHPALQEPLGHLKGFGRQGMVMDRSWEIPFEDHMKEYHEGYAGLDWGNWHGETRGPEMYSEWNNIDHAFRTLHLAKGDKPYVLVVDDIRKDDMMHQYDWVMSLSPDVTLASADSSVRGRYLEKGMPDNRMTDIVLCLKDTKEERVQRYGLKSHRVPQKGEPMLLVRTLWRNSTYAFPQPAFEQGYGPGRVIIPAMAEDPEFRVLLYPYRHGDQLPLTSWNDDQTILTVTSGENTDVYRFDKTDDERTIFTVERNGEHAASIQAGPPAPQFDTDLGWTPDRNLDDEVRTVIFNDNTEVKLQAAALGNVIRYTTDGSEPTEDSKAYEAPVRIKDSCTFKARTFARYWPHSDNNGSHTLELNLVQRDLTAPIKSKKVTSGLACEVFEIRRTIFNEKTGIFTGKKNMLPTLNDHKPIAAFRTANFDIPKVDPVTEATEMKKAYYQFTGFIELPTDGTYSFRLNACGPIQLNIGEQELISVTGVYGLSQKNRYGQATLKAGTHPIELVVTDPVFWQGERAEAYVIDMDIMAPGQSTFAEITDNMLSSTKSNLKFQKAPKIPTSKAVKVADVTSGLILNSYDRSDRYRIMPANGYSLEHFDTKGETAYQSTPTLVIDASHTAGRVDEYQGYFHADTSGVYTFELDRIGGNQLIIGNQEVARNSIVAPSLPGLIDLEKGWHTFTLRLSGSKPTLNVKVPGQDSFQPVQIGSFARAEKAVAEDDGRLVAHIQPKLNDLDQLQVEGGSAIATLRKGAIVDTDRGPAIQLTGKESGIVLEGVESPNDALTVSFWIKSNKSTEAMIVKDTRFSNPGARLRGYNLQGYYYRGSAFTSTDLRQEGLNKGEWVHIALAYSQKVEVYVNGALSAWTPKTEITRTAHVQDFDILRNLDAAVQDIRIYNKTLSADEVKALSEK